jgi:hypothetical protein
VLVPTNVIDHTGSISNLYLMLTLMTVTPGACGNERPVVPFLSPPEARTAPVAVDQQASHGKLKKTCPE